MIKARIRKMSIRTIKDIIIMWKEMECAQKIMKAVVLRMMMMMNHLFLRSHRCLPEMTMTTRSPRLVRL
jgi:hypothetical protein